MGTVYRRGEYWCINYRYHGQQIRRRIGPDRKTAELALKDIEVKLAKGDYLGIYEEKKVTFREFAQEFLTVITPDVAPGTRREYDAKLRNSLLPAFGSRYLAQIAVKDVEMWKAQRAKVVGPKRLNDELTLFKRMLTKARGMGYTKNDPGKDVKKARLPDRRPRFLTEEEVTRILDTAPAEWQAVIATGVYAGLRAGELVHLEWSDIDFQKGTLTVQNKADWTTKSKKNRTIPMAPALVPYLRRHPRHVGSPYVFCDNAGNRRDSHLWVLETIGRHAGIATDSPPTA
ncbi:MAG: tyrosine-type recombinase/integrase [Candidatus Latescibacteria bacterium]|nr:tyrosine-type recombinase/integrase [Candidatus Latescibacterota bacterium]